jgi:hypothetical protein
MAIASSYLTRYNEMTEQVLSASVYLTFDLRNSDFGSPRYSLDYTMERQSSYLSDIFGCRDRCSSIREHCSYCACKGECYFSRWYWTEFAQSVILFALPPVHASSRQQDTVTRTVSEYDRKPMPVFFFKCKYSLRTSKRTQYFTITKQKSTG